MAVEWSWAAALRVALGSAIGGLMRYGVSVATAALFGTAFPLATLLVNVFGGGAIGLLAAVTGEGWLPLSGQPWMRQLLMTGVLGGFTTFSSFSLDTVVLLRNGQAGAAALNVVLSLTLSLAACGLGVAVGRGLVR